jgi:hydrogenase large subunit
MAERVVVDPVTRIEGHLRIEVETEGGFITNAWAESTQYRGLETIVENRDPRDVWAFLQRICGVCTTTHAIASIVAVEDAIGIEVPVQAQLIRDIILGAQTAHDHTVHFYHLQALDWVNVVSASQAKPEDAVAFAQAIGSTWTGNSLERFTKVAETVNALIDSGQLSIFTGGYWDHPAYKLPPEANLMAVSHYLDALEFQRSVVRIQTVFGGKNPHPNFLVGGMACSIDPDKSETVNSVQIDQIRNWINEAVTFATECYLPDVIAIMGAHKDWFDIGATEPHFLAVGMIGATFPGDPAAAPYRSTLSPIEPGVLLDGDFVNVKPFDPALVTEYISSAWYTYEAGDDAAVHPDVGETTPKYTGKPTPWEWIADAEDGKYTWSKAPRYDDKVVQVGPAARVLVAYASGHERTREIVDGALSTIGIRLEQLNSTAGRILCRAIETVTAVELMQQVSFPAFISNIAQGDIEVFNGAKWAPSQWPSSCQGYCYTEVPRGTLSHHVTIEGGKTKLYQCVVPTTWNAAGRDPMGQLGPYEYSLAGDGNHPLVIPDQPLEIMRTIHSYDPCMSCGVHVLDPSGEEITRLVTP